MRNGDMVDLSLEALSEFDQVVCTSFSSENEAFNFYNSYALKKGFSVRKCYVERDKRSKKIFKRKFVCSQQGFREMKHMEKKNRKRKARNITRCGCSAKLVVKWSDKIGRWFVLDFEPEHSHNLGTPDSTCFFRSHRGLSDAQKADIAEMEIAGIRKHQIMDILEMQSGGFDKVNCTARDIYNYCYKDKQRTIVAGDAETVISNLKVRQERDPDFFFDYFTDENGHLKGLFWCDAQSRLDYEAFGEVLVFDSTYRTNRYNLPFVPFVGLNHHRSTVIFGCAIISHETAKAYEWILKTFLTAMAQKHPISVITDGDLAMQSAIRNILPTSNHRLCTWHIERNMIKNLHNEKIVEEFRTFLYDCCSISELEVKWEQFIQRNKVSDPNSWLHQMYQMRRLWCAAYQVGKRFWGLKSNQRSESLNSKLHTHLDSRMTLFDLLRHYEHCLSNIRRNEAMLDSLALHSTPFTELDASNIEKDAAVVFTPTVFALVKEKIHSASDYVIIEILDGFGTAIYVLAMKDKIERKFHVDVEFNESSVDGIRCSCRMMECNGIPCGHIFKVINILRAEKIPKCCVDRRWTMGAKSAFPPIRKSNMYDHSQSLERFRELRRLSTAACLKSSQNNASYVHMKHVLSGIVGASDDAKTAKEHLQYGPGLPQTMRDKSDKMYKVLDPVQVKSRGAPKKARMKGFMDKPKRTRKCKLCNKTGHNRRTCSKYKELEVQKEVEEVGALKTKSCSGRSSGKKTKARLPEEDDFVDDNRSDSSLSGSTDYVELGESDSNNDCDGVSQESGSKQSSAKIN